MRPRSACLLPLLLLLGGLQADSQEEVRALVGDNVNLSCVYPHKESFDLKKLHVYWQINVTDKQEPVAYYLAGNSSVGHNNNQYKDRAHMSLEAMEQGNFSLRLYNVTPQDEQKYNCLVFQNYHRILHAVVRLQVAANYSMPVVSQPSGTAEDKEVTVTCTSTDGYPRPNVYWVNKTDNSLLDEALQDSNISLNARGLYDVVSVLRTRQVPNMNVGCIIENVLLHQNLTVSSQTRTDTFQGPSDHGTEIPRVSHTEITNVVVTIAVLAMVLGAGAVGWWCRSRCPRHGYAGAQASRPELELNDFV